MTAQDRIQAARSLLETVTPLKTDCGKRCGAACCQSDEDGNGGMLLFPGEEALCLPDIGWATISESGLLLEGKPVWFFTCDGTCPREARPLACRIFPLTPIIGPEGEPSVVLDVRAWPVCPLMSHGIDGLSREFVAAVTAATALLYEDETCRAYMALLTQQLAAFTTL